MPFWKHPSLKPRDTGLIIVVANRDLHRGKSLPLTIVKNDFVTRSIRTLPVVEKWDCQCCGLCCHGNTIILDNDDLTKLRSQHWEKHPAFRGVKTVVRESLLGGRHVLAKRADGACVFLNQKGRCRIHESHGADSKPAICRMFPLQVVTLERTALLTTRRSCPAAAADRGRALDMHLAPLKRSGLVARFASFQTRPPAIARGARRSWHDFLATAEVLERLTTDERLPLVRRLLHGLRFCTLLRECNISRVKERSWDELLHSFEELAVENSGEFFRDQRRPPSRGTKVVLRQIGAHFIRSYPGFTFTGSWYESLRILFMSTKFARGKGAVPLVHPEFPPTTFEDLERPLGALDHEVIYPLNRLFETQASSKYYAIVGHNRSLVESFRSLVFLYPIGLWLLRLAIGEREPKASDVVNIVVALERGQGLAGLSRGATALASSQQLERAIVWYAR